MMEGPPSLLLKAWLLSRKRAAKLDNIKARININTGGGHNANLQWHNNICTKVTEGVRTRCPVTLGRRAES